MQIPSTAAIQSGQEDSWTEFDSPRTLAELRACLSTNPAARVLVVGDNTFAAKAGALGGLSTMMEPRNLEDGRLDAKGVDAFVEAWKVDYVLLGDTARADSVRDLFELRPVEACRLPMFAIENGSGRTN